MLTRREKIMGFGHRVYRVVDPRALVLKEFATRLAQENDPKWFQMSERLEQLMKERKGIDMNVDWGFYGNWGASFVFAYDRLLGDAEDSPIVDDRGSPNQVFGGVLIGYKW